MGRHAWRDDGWESELRLPGYYWVRFPSEHMAAWEPAYFNGETWEVIGELEEKADADFAEIGCSIER